MVPTPIQHGIMDKMLSNGGTEAEMPYKITDLDMKKVENCTAI